MRHLPLFTATAIVAALSVAAAPASAQTAGLQGQQPVRPYRGLFASGLAETSQSLILTASFGSGYDDDLTPTAGSSLTPTGQATVPRRNGQFTRGSANLRYTLSRSRVSAGLFARANGRHYAGLSDPLVGTYSGGGQLSVQIGKRTALSTSHSAGLFLRNLAGFYGTELGTGSIPNTPVNPVTFTDTETYKSLRSDVRLSHQITTRWEVHAGYAYYSDNVWTGTSLGRYGVQSGSAGVSYALTKGLGLRLGYTVTDAGFGGNGALTPVRGRTIDAGIDFRRALSLTRRSTLSFATGVVGISDQARRTRYVVTGNADFSYELGRSWSISTQYNRSADFYQTLGQPVVADRVSAGVGGVIGRRVHVNTGGGFIRGTVGVASGSPGYTASSANVGVGIGLHRMLALEVNYGFYRYEFDGGTLLPPGLLPRMDRQSVRVSLNVWVPLMTRSRSINASR